MTNESESRAQRDPASVITKTSPHSVSDTVSRLLEVVASKGMKVFAVIDHSGEAVAPSCW